jgi:hypothetical protein
MMVTTLLDSTFWQSKPNVLSTRGDLAFPTDLNTIHPQALSLCVTLLRSMLMSIATKVIICLRCRLREVRRHRSKLTLVGESAEGRAPI